MKNGRPQAKDVSDLDVLRVVRELMTESYEQKPMIDAYLWTLRSDIQARFPGVPEKVVLAKLASLVRRKLIDGCACGCRGDFVLTPVGLAFVESAPSPA